MEGFDKMIKVAEFEYSMPNIARKPKLEIQINDFFRNTKINRNNLIDIKYTSTENESTCTYYALIIYDGQ